MALDQSRHPDPCCLIVSLGTPGGPVDKQKYDPPSLSPSAWDAAHQIARAGLSALPVIGGPATELLSFLITPPLLLRQQKWLEEIAEVIRSLEQHAGINPEQLRDDP